MMKYVSYKSWCKFVTVFISGITLIIAYHSLQHQTREESTSTHYLFTNNSYVRHCIAGHEIGTRPTVDLVLFSTLECASKDEATEERIASFKNIYEKRIWVPGKKRSAAASGKIL